MARLPIAVFSAAGPPAAAVRDAAAGRKNSTAPRQQRSTAVTPPVASYTGSVDGKKFSERISTQSRSRATPPNNVTEDTQERGMRENNKKACRNKAMASNKPATSVPNAAVHPAAAAKTSRDAAASAKKSPSAPKASEAQKQERRRHCSDRNDTEDSPPASNSTRGTKSSKKNEAAHRMSDALYTLLGVSKDATAAEIGKAYRALALLLHPDKVLHRLHEQQQQQRQQNSEEGKKENEAGDGDNGRKDSLNWENCALPAKPAKEQEYIERMRQEATRHFQELQRAYAVLKDPAKRSLYDRTGVTGEDGEEPQTFEAAYAYYRTLFPEIDACAIEKFEEKYLGSDEERDDIKQFCEKFNGDLSHFFEFIPFSEKKHLPRYVKILNDFLVEKEVAHATKLTKKAIDQLEQQAQEMEKLTAREATQLEKQKNSAASQKQPKKRKGRDSHSLQTLAMAIQANANKRAKEGSNFLDQLAQKYGGQNADGRRKSHGK